MFYWKMANRGDSRSLAGKSGDSRSLAGESGDTRDPTPYREFGGGGGAVGDAELVDGFARWAAWMRAGAASMPRTVAREGGESAGRGPPWPQARSRMCMGASLRDFSSRPRESWRMPGKMTFSAGIRSLGRRRGGRTSRRRFGPVGFFCAGAWGGRPADAGGGCGCLV